MTTSLPSSGECERGYPDIVQHGKANIQHVKGKWKNRSYKKADNISLGGGDIGPKIVMCVIWW
jgi:hypothetical protein